MSAPRRPTIASHESAGRIGLVVNPVAGIGGEVGLGGSDGSEIQAAAAALGGAARSPERAARFVRQLRALAPEAALVTVRGDLEAALVPDAQRVEAGVRAGSGADSQRAASALAAAGVDLLVFVGGDGTARDVLAGVPAQQACLGVPSGVKMHSGVFAVTPEDAAAQAAAFARGDVAAQQREVADIDEEARRSGVLSASIYGQMLVPKHERVQRGKRSPAHGSGIDAAGVASELRRIAAGHHLVLGPGTTLARIAERLGVTPTLLGFDVLSPDGEQMNGVTGSQLEHIMQANDVTVVLSPIGGQGFVIGRGNHQLTAHVLERLRREQLVVVAEVAKLGELRGLLRIDAPTLELNEKFRGPQRVLLGAGDIAIATIE